MILNSKERARELVRGRLSTLTDIEYTDSSTAAVERAGALLARIQKTHNVRNGLLYRVMKKWHEVDISSLEDDFPEIQFEYVPQDSSAPFPVVTYDIIFVPLYGFTSEGYRLGRGSGWYDRFLVSQPRAVKIGVGLSVGLVKFRAAPHDIQMDSVITEGRTITHANATKPLF